MASSGTLKFFKVLTNSRNKQEKHFGLLERPNLPPHVDELRYKVLVTGQPGAGKSHIISWLAGWDEFPIHATTSAGTQTTVINCTCEKLIPPQKTYLFQLQMWEMGGLGKKIISGSDILASCPENIDGIVTVFSWGDHSNFQALPAIIEQVKAQSKIPKPCFICVGNGWSLEELPTLTLQEIQDFEETTLVPIIRIPLMKPTDGHEVWADHREDVLSFICEQLWQRDHVIVEQGFADDFEGTESPVLI